MRPERDHGVLGAAEHLVDVDVVEERQPLPADLLRMAERPQAGGLGLVHQAAQQRARRVAALVELRLDRLDALLDELPHARAQRPDVFGHFEAHG